ncbi:NAD-dependent epimerase/dehydratase family protein [Natronospira bacteriovora]|uniref:NAD-dependent epimerase/dehydratase family protein n=1 Tax=Natronospira bacteriovora TaxID=3069753 RepID=A0ABU0W772_9GAMM|nr:NAD-dependent epimerase/dehydratase family protein [Natronospira sp. AB-CW4]MDQ2069846.1 NAD-dependent epimerase/dehydratase family protein [Natronospira sp. AB-CW4]
MPGRLRDLPLLIVGAGDSGQRLARRWHAAGGGPVTALRRRIHDCPDLPGVHWLSFDLDADAPPPELPVGGVMVWLAPPPRQGREDERIRRHLPALLAAQQPERLVLASTTGVYGPGNESGWTDEDSPLRPDSDRAWRRVSAERQAESMTASAGVDLIRLRIAAIYGPGRLPLSRLRAAEPLSADLADRPGNRIHVDDLVSVLFQAALQGKGGGVYNVSDGHPQSFGAYLDACADAFGLPRLPRDGQAEGDPAADFLRASRRIRADRMLRELGVQLRFADMHDGIRASLAEPADA